MGALMKNVEVFDIQFLPPIDIDIETMEAITAHKLGLVHVGKGIIENYRQQVKILTAPIHQDELVLCRAVADFFLEPSKFDFYGNSVPIQILECYSKALEYCAFESFSVWVSSSFDSEYKEFLLLGFRDGEWYKIGRWSTGKNISLLSDEKRAEQVRLRIFREY